MQNSKHRRRRKFLKFGTVSTSSTVKKDNSPKNSELIQFEGDLRNKIFCNSKTDVLIKIGSPKSLYRILRCRFGVLRLENITYGTKYKNSVKRKESPLYDDDVTLEEFNQLLPKGTSAFQFKVISIQDVYDNCIEL